MADQFTTVTTKGYGSRIVDSIKGIGMGILLFLASFGVLYWNEGRVNLSDVAKDAVEIKADVNTGEANGKLISVNGKVVTDEKLGDSLYLKDGDYLAFSRNVEMYAWVQKTESKSDKNLGGSETTNTTYTYVKEWTGSPASSSDFQYPADHFNPTKTIESINEKTVSAAKVGVYDLDMANIDLPEFSSVTMNDVNIGVPAGQGTLTGGYVFVPGVAVSGVAGTLAAPNVGDLRINFTVLKNNTDATVFGKLDGNKIIKFVDFERDNAELYRMFTSGGTDGAVGQLDKEHDIMTWVLRAVGFLMMWIGLGALFGPLSALLDVVPFFGSLSRGIVGVITLVISLVLSGATILISMILHSLIAVIVTALVIVGIAVFIMKKKGHSPTVVRA